MHCYSGAKQIFYQTNVLVSAQHGCCHKVATGNPWEPHDFVRLVWLQQEDVPLEIKKLVLRVFILHILSVKQIKNGKEYNKKYNGFRFQPYLSP